jgi:hypothetical protein
VPYSLENCRNYKASYCYVPAKLLQNQSLNGDTLRSTVLTTYFAQITSKLFAGIA